MISPGPRNLATCSQDEIQKFLNSFDNVLLDCDGVVKLLDNVIDGVPESIRFLKKNGKNIKYITNNCIMSRSLWNDMFERSRMDSNYDDILCPTKAIIKYLKSINFKKKLLVMGSKAMQDELRNSAFEIYDYKEDHTFESEKDVQGWVVDDLSVGGVISDIDIYASFLKNLKASIFLKRSDVCLIYGANDKFVPVGKGYKTFGPHFYNSGLETVTDRKPNAILSKPSKMFQEFVTAELKLVPSRTLFIGDSIESDMKFASEMRIQKMLVLTGVSKLDDFYPVNNNLLPQYYLQSLGDFHKLLS